MIDILIIGNGGAGLTTALEVKKSCNNVVVLSKTSPTTSQTSQAQGGINAVLNEQQDSIENHINDTLKSAHGIGDENTIKYMCSNSKDTIKWLDDIGIAFSRDESANIAQRKLGGASNPRACYSSDYTGLKILHTLYDNCIKEQIEFINDYMLLELIIEDDTVKGVVCLDIQTSQIKQILAKKVIIATGGYAGIYNKYNTNSTATTGDAIGVAIRAGVELENMEYIQFHPTALKDSCILISESARGEGGYLVTQDEKRFVDELAARDVVARAIYTKIQNNEDVFLDLRHLGLEKIMETMPQEYHLAYDFTKLKLDNDLIQIAPAAHYTMGGIKTNLNGETNIKNLYAVGECASNGVHGANRLGGNSLLEIITFGRLIGNHVTKDIDTIKDYETKEFQVYKDSIKNIEELFNKTSQINFYDIKKELGKLFYENVGLFRDEDNLQKVSKQLTIWNNQLNLMGITDKSKIFNTNLKEFLEFKNILQLSSTIVNSAIYRKESRGAHFRVDFNSEDIKYSKSTIISKDGEII
ncbi:MAG: FAD-dependent oxidoreductase [Campylobacterota bacterium]|nr:FAD-dependent oxidoreductase [Campylobacterota bacterium]